MILFGVGTLYAIPLTDNTGTAIANPTPVQFGILQDIASDLSFDKKLLYGAYVMPVAFGRGKGKFDFKAKFADIRADVLAGLFFGNTGSVLTALRSIVDNSPIVGAASVVIAPPSSGVFATDLGVRYASTGLPLKVVPSAPTVGQYTINAGTGTYVFTGADIGANLLISYEYTAAASAISQQVPFANTLMGQAPTFLAELNLPYGGKNLVIKLNSCIGEKFAMPFKNEDFSIADFEFTALADAGGNIGTFALR